MTNCCYPISNKLAARPNPWLAGKRSAQSRLTLVCFPYAGGGSSLWMHWRDKLPAWVDVLIVQLPGRGARMMEPPVRNMAALVPHLSEAVAGLGNTVLFGHSMGAFLAYETARRLHLEGKHMPLGMIVSGQRAPHLPEIGRKAHALPRHEFLQELRHRGGTPEELLHDAELMELLMPMLRADFELCECYQPTGSKPLDIPLCAFCGSQDERAGHSRVAGWSSHTTAGFKLTEFAGGHFFVHEAEDQVLATINNIVREWRDLAA